VADVAAEQQPDSSKDSRIAATKKSRPPLSRPSLALASASSMPKQAACASRSRASTMPPGNTQAPLV
jgi:hypothetical protein